MKRKPELMRFARAALLAAVGRSKWLLGVFVIGVILMEVAANLMYDVIILHQPLTRSLGVRAAVLVGSLLAIAGVFYALDIHQARSRPMDIRVETIEPHPGLIWLLSPGNPDALLKVMQHHSNPAASEQARLRHCWVILSDHPGVETTYADLPEEMERWGISPADVTLHAVSLPQANIETTYRAVTSIYENQVAAVDLRPDHVVTDLTGGCKLMTAGALIACLSPSDEERPIEYLLSDRHPVTGEPIAGSEHPMRVDVAFYSPQAGASAG